MYLKVQLCLLLSLVVLPAYGSDAAIPEAGLIRVESASVEFSGTDTLIVANALYGNDCEEPDHLVKEVRRGPHQIKYRVLGYNMISRICYALYDPVTRRVVVDRLPAGHGIKTVEVNGHRIVLYQ